MVKMTREVVKGQLNAQTCLGTNCIVTAKSLTCFKVHKFIYINKSWFELQTTANIQLMAGLHNTLV